MAKLFFNINNVAFIIMFIFIKQIVKNSSKLLTMFNHTLLFESVYLKDKRCLVKMYNNKEVVILLFKQSYL